MSFILDALRKSDAERQRAATPGLADVRYAARRSRRNLWMPVLVLVLIANMLFMGIQWYRGQSATPAAPVAAPGAVPAVAAPVPASGIRPLAREAELGEPEPGVAEPEALPAEPTTRPMPAPVARLPPPPMEAEADLLPAPPKPKGASRITEGPQLPSAADLIAAGTLSTPALNLDLHVYSASPAGRFVIINGRKYKDGAQLTEGPVVKSITEEGVILENQGKQFVLLNQ
jgi:general secretion pathway protein B